MDSILRTSDAYIKGWNVKDELMMFHAFVMHWVKGTVEAMKTLNSIVLSFLKFETPWKYVLVDQNVFCMNPRLKDIEYTYWKIANTAQ